MLPFRHATMIAALASAVLVPATARAAAPYDPSWRACDTDEVCVPVQGACGEWQSVNAGALSLAEAYYAAIAPEVECMAGVSSADSPPPVLCSAGACATEDEEPVEAESVSGDLE